MKRAARAGVYVHFPWCLAKCPYCDFVSYATPRESVPHEAYANAVLRELDTRASSFQERQIASVFFGGGTPSLWDPLQLGRVLRGIRERLTCTVDLEVTVECNPTSLDRERADALFNAGVDRLSIGTQSLDQKELSFLGRLHDPNGALAAIDGALGSRVPRVSTDLIFGLPEQSPEQAASQAVTLADRGLRHLSCYQLTIEPGTRFGELAKRGRLPLADDGRVADAFLAIHEALTSRGLTHYEISNYAFAGQEARHNLGYWRGEEYLGLGCGAYGFARNETGGVRWRNAVDPTEYLAHGGDPTTSDEPLLPHQLLQERIMLGLRLATGFDLTEAGQDLGLDPWTNERKATVEALVTRGRLTRNENILRIPTASWLFTDDTAARLF